MSPQISKRAVTVDLCFFGNGRVVEHPKNVFNGGVPDPVLGPQLGFNVLPETPSEVADSTVPDLDGYEGALQVNLWGTSDDYRALGRYLLAIAELDTTADPGFHQHHEGLQSSDGRTRLNLIVRKVL
jgi:hypothetical protein